MRRLFFLSLIIISCSSPTPKNVFPPEKMEAVWYDIIRADELVDFSVIQDSTYRDFSKRSALYDSIFHIHQISKEGFQHSMSYYQGRPDLLKDILDALHKRTDPANFKLDSSKMPRIKKQAIKEIVKPE